MKTANEETFTCKMFRDHLRAFVDNELTGKIKTYFLEHASQCVACNKALNEMKRIKKILSNLATVSTSPDFDFQLKARIRMEDNLLRKPLYRAKLFFNDNIRLFFTVPALALLIFAAVFLYVDTQNTENLLAGSDIQSDVVLISEVENSADEIVYVFYVLESVRTIKLGQAGKWIVRGLDSNADSIQAARERIARAGLSGSISAELWHGRSLPFIDNSVNVIIVDNGAEVDMQECERALRPGGRVYFRKAGIWRHSTKECPGNTDEWTHALYDASGGSVSKDLVVGPPRRLQWAAGSKWTRHHESASSFQAMVSAAGRVFYLLDEGPHVSLFLPSNWQLIARDAYNGKLLWKRPFRRWVSPLFTYKSGPTQMTRRLVAAGDRLFVAANLDEGVTVVDARTGETVRTLENTAASEEILYHGGRLYLITNDDPVMYQRGHRYSEENVWSGQKKWIRAVDPQTGSALWKYNTPVAPMAFAVSEKGVFFHDGQCIIALDAISGKKLFKSGPVVLDSVIATATTPTLAIHKDVVLFWGGDDQPGFRKSSGSAASNNLRTFTAMSAVDGRILWSYQTPNFSTGFECPKDIIVIDDLVWLGIMMGRERAGTWTGRDIHTGEIVRKFEPRKEVYWFHQRCHRSKATEKYIISGRTGVEFISPKTGWESMNHWVRGACIYGTMPANGLLYQPPHPCACYIESLLRGFNALAPAGRKDAGVGLPSERLHRGPAHEKPVPSAAAARNSSDQWPTFRHDNARSCFVPRRIGTDLTIKWKSRTGTKLSAMTVADGKLFVADIDAHVLYALDARTGQHAWKYIAGARIDSPPSIAFGRALFGSRDGYLNCLNAADGELVWRYRVAPSEKYLLAREQLESVWPVHGSPLVVGEKVYCVAGRSAFLDGGMRLVCIDINSGRKLHEEVIDGQDPTTGGELMDKMSNRTLPVANPDVLSCNGRSIFMNTQRFELDCSRPVVAAMRRASDQLGEDAHLFVNSGFLDGSGFHRVLMLYGRTFSGGDSSNHAPPRFAPGGKMLAFNDTHAFGFSRLPHLHRWVRSLEWHVYKASKTDRKKDPPWSKNGRVIDLSSHDVVIQTDSADQDELTRLKRSLLSSTIKYDWSNHDPDLYVNSMILTDDLLYIAGPPAIRNEGTEEALARWRGERGGRLWCLSTETGKKMGKLRLSSPPVYEGLAAAYGRIFIAQQDGSVICVD